MYPQSSINYDTFMIVFIYDILVHSRTYKENEMHLKKVVTMLKASKLYLARTIDIFQSYSFKRSSLSWPTYLEFKPSGLILVLPHGYKVS